MDTGKTKTQEDSLYKKLMKRFTPAEGLKIEDYYGVLTMKYKKNNHYQIRLIHDYVGGKPKTSSILEVKDKEQFYLALIVLEDRCRPERESAEVDDLFDLDESEPEGGEVKMVKKDF